MTFYIKVIHKGESSSSEQLKRYSDNGVEWLYFLNSDRSLYISYQNDLTRQLIDKSPTQDLKIFKAMKSVTEKFIEEIYVEGLPLQLIEEGKLICQNMYDAAMKDQGLKFLMNQLEDFDPRSYSHAFLVSFFSTAICKNLDWVGRKSIDTLALGALLHDIGRLKLPSEFLELEIDDLTPEQKVIYEQHPALGAETLQAMPDIPQGVATIVLQHHELMSGDGYPQKLAGMKIFPLAKVVGLADAFSDFISKRKLNPIVGLKEFLAVRENMVNYDPALIKNLIVSFTGDKKDTFRRVK